MNAQLSQEIDQALAQLEEAQSSLDKLEGLGDTPPASSPRSLPWAWLLAGLGLGLAGGVALALTLTGALT